ncbi:MAG: hypothetical protein PVI51_09535 [candidate division WOR-3 bacterium]|jgi:hypothetical protein
MFLIFFLLNYAPEDSNAHYLLDKQLARYFPAWDSRYDDVSNALRTSQGCLDFWHWYINLETKLEANLASWFGVRYRNRYLGDYDRHVSNHHFEPFFQLRDYLRFLFTVAPHYYKGEDELGLGFFWGRDYRDYVETFVILEDFDRNYSYKNTPDGPDKITYQTFPVKWQVRLNRYWSSGHLALASELTNRYFLRSTEHELIYPPYFQERGLHRSLNARFWQDIGKFRAGMVLDVYASEQYNIDTSRVHTKDIFEALIEPMFAYSITDKWQPTLYFTYNYKTEDDSLLLFSTGIAETVDYRRDVFAYLIDVEFHPGGSFIWHFGMQQQFYANNQGRSARERRFTLGLEYRYKNVWFYIVEAMEGDYPMPNWLHNRTYVQLMLTF